MFKNYLKLSFRNLKRHKGFSFINITGLAIGITCFIFIIQYLLHETSYDNYHKNIDQIYRVNLDIESDSDKKQYAINVPPVGPSLKENFPQIVESARIFNFFGTRLVEKDDNKFYEKGFVYADKEIFRILSYSFLHGDPETALNNPLSLVLPERLAKKYFRNENPVGQSLSLDGHDYNITAVIKDAPQNTHLQYDMFISMDDLRNPPWMQDWTWPGMWTFVRLAPNTDVKILNEQIRNYANSFTKNNPMAAGKTYQYSLQHIRDIYLSKELEYDLPKGNKIYLYIFSGVGFFILLIACINFVNLMTARVTSRAKEVGIRKSVGAIRNTLIQQFLCETIVLVLFAFILSLLLVEIIRPVFTNITNIDFNFSSLFTFKSVFLWAGMILCIGLIAGFYPAFVLSSFNPGKVLKGSVNTVSGSSKFRKILVIAQFSISIILIISTIIVYNQITFMKTMNLGFNKKHKMIIPVTGMAPLTTNENVKNAFQQIPSVSMASVSSYVPGEGAGSHSTKLVDQKDAKEQMMYYGYYDTDFISQYDIKILAGRNFKKEMITDINNSCLINETSSKAFGWSSPSEAIGKVINTGMEGRNKTIIGVVNDFHFRSAHYKIEPLIMENDPRMFKRITLSVNDKNFNKTIEKVEIVWNELFPDQPLVYYFLDASINGLYESEECIGKLFRILTILGIFIASLGLFGLATFMAEKKTKEIGIRKTLGATVLKIVLLLSKEFFVCVLLANLIAWPLAYVIMNNWLHNFSYQIDITIGVFLQSGILALIIVGITVTFQSVKAATANPIKSLRYE